MLIYLSDDVAIDKGYVEKLHKAGLVSFDDFMNFTRGKLVKRRGRKEVWQVEIDGNLFFLKKRLSSLWDFLSALMRGGMLGFYGLKELHNIALLNRLGFETVKPVAAGSRWHTGFVNEAFLMTEAVDAVTLDAFLRDEFAPPLTKEQIERKRNLLRQLAKFISRLHSLGLYHQDLFLYHLAVQENEHNEYRFILLDLDRLTKALYRRRAMIKDLAKLLLSSYDVPLSATDRWRFYLEYAKHSKIKPMDVALIRRIWDKAVWVGRKNQQMRNALKRMQEELIKSQRCAK
ncbi:MAG: hypothetical protein RUDDFDWM_001311 [Candidatus Fervidibacterota bacterium]